MNNPDNIPIDVLEQRNWLLEHKAATGQSWTLMARETGIAAGTLSQFGPGTYKGDNERIAREVFRYRQHLATQAELNGELPEVPGFFETPTSRRILALLSFAHRGRMTAISTGAGCGKTTTARHYKESVSNCWIVTLSPAIRTVPNVLLAICEAIGDGHKFGHRYALRRHLDKRLKRSGGLLIIDEAQHASLDMIEELRSLYDLIGIGIALLGNEMVISRIEGGTRRAEYAQLYSRLGMRHAQNLPHPDDARSLARAWDIDDDKLTAFIVAKSQQPGGLRTVTSMLEIATMIAHSERDSLSLTHLQEAWAQLVSRPIAA
jgi:DNA transposition AAA+ family ATPase